jgi:hypothetical protein
MPPPGVRQSHREGPRTSWLSSRQVAPEYPPSRSSRWRVLHCSEEPLNFGCTCGETVLLIQHQREHRFPRFAANLTALGLPVARQEALSKEANSQDNCGMTEHTIRTLRKRPRDRTDLDMESIMPNICVQGWLDALPAEAQEKGALRTVVKAMVIRELSRGGKVSYGGEPIDTFIVVIAGCIEEKLPLVGGEPQSALHPLRKFRPGMVVGGGFASEAEEKMWERDLEVGAVPAKSHELHIRS